MKASKTGGPLKSLFTPEQRAAAAAVMEPSPAPASPQPAHVSAARNRKAGGRSVRISGYVPEDIEEALRDEVIRRTNATRRIVSLNDVLCDILAAWKAGRGTAQ
jgi:hypothetical protein